MRISRGTPYVLSSTDIEITLKALTPRVEEAIAAVLDISVEEWRKLDDRVRVKHVLEFQQRAQLTSMLAAGARSHTDLEEAAFVVTRATRAEHVDEDLQALKELVVELSEQVAALKEDSTEKGRK